MSEQNKDLVRSYYDQVLNGRDLDAVGEFFADFREVRDEDVVALLALRSAAPKTSRAS